MTVPFRSREAALDDMDRLIEWARSCPGKGGRAERSPVAAKIIPLHEDLLQSARDRHDVVEILKSNAEQGQHACVYPSFQAGSGGNIARGRIQAAFRGSCARLMGGCRIDRKTVHAVERIGSIKADDRGAFRDKPGPVGTGLL